uniref:SFRICE_010582 n=1 Tax=Spodoptera frugiperda TaxID=7108 RepID=A0A2H1VLT4_SPOFR
MEAVEAVNGTLAEMRAEFQERMARFEAGHSSTPSNLASGGTSALAQDYWAFKRFMMDELNCLQRQMEFIVRDMDALEMKGRRKMLLLHGVIESQTENTAILVAKIIEEVLDIDSFTTSDIRRCQRVPGKTSPRPILVKMKDVDTRDKVWFNKTKLKGTGITVSEYLTKTRHQLFVAARNKFGVTKCWTNAGDIYVLGPDGDRHRIVTFSELRAIREPSTVHERSPVGWRFPIYN